MKGSSLVEVLVSLVVLSLAILTAVTVEFRGVALVRASGLASQANQLLSNALNENQAGMASGDWCAGWQAQVAQALPEGEGQVIGVGDQVRVAVTWYDQSLQRMRVVQGAG